MLKMHQQKILETLGTLEAARIELKRFTEKKMFADARHILSDSAAFVEQIQGFTRNIAGGGTQTDALLEAYRNSLLEEFGAIGGDNRNIDSHIKLYKKQLVKIENSVKDELKPDRIEAAFFPYNASMADSLESVYLAAKSDPMCDAYWVPIPYYDYNADHTLGQMHYDGEKYPHLPVTDWQKYDLEARRPDIIFAHAPYDNDNVVTCVHQNFHFEKMRQLTDMLVYVPYFAGMGDVCEEECVCAGTVYADKVIAQSAKARDTYIRVFGEWVKSVGLKKNHPQWAKFSNLAEKFVILGSPKVDAAINAVPEKFPLPSDWAALLTDSARGKKKVILYNIRFTDINDGIENKIAKLKYVLELFKKRNDVVLWWRPHPLNMECLRSMTSSSQYLTEYKQIVDQYQSEGWGIYDDTEKLHRAIAWSDAYYGDQSTVAGLYLVTGKPVMIQNIYRLNAFSDAYTDFIRFCVRGTEIWFSAVQFNALFKYSITTQKAEYVSNFPAETFIPQDGRFFGTPGCSGNKLYFPPMTAKNLFVYDTETNSSAEFAVKEPETPVAGGHTIFKFQKTVFYKDQVFFIPHSYPAIIRMDRNTNECFYYNDWVQFIPNAAANCFFRDCAVNESQIIMPSFRSNQVVLFDMDTYSSTVTEVGSKGNRYTGITSDGVFCWIAPMSAGAIVKWNLKDYSWVEISNYPNDFKPGANPFHLSVFCIDNWVYLLPYNANMALKICVDDDSVHIADEFQQICDEQGNVDYRKDINYLFASESNGVIYARVGKQQKMITYNTRNHERKELVINLSDDSLERLLTLKNFAPMFDETEPNKPLSDYTVYENILGIETLINFITDSANTEKIALRREEQRKFYTEAIPNPRDAGEHIYTYIKDEVLRLAK